MSTVIPRRRLAIVLGLNQTMTWGMTFYLPAVITGPVAVSLGASSFSVLGAFTWSLLVTGALAPRIGRWIDSAGGRTPLALSIVVTAVGQVMLATAPNLIVWYVGWTVIGAGMACGLYDAAFATAGVLLGKDAGPAITGITLLAGFASTVFWSLGAILISTLGWRGLLLLYAVLQIAVNLPMVLFLLPHKTPTPIEVSHSDSQSGTAQPRRLVATCLASFFTIRWFITSMIAVNVLRLLQGIGLTLSEAVFVAALIGPGQVAGRILEWSIADRMGLLVRARLGALLFPLGALVLLAGGPIAAVLFAVFYGMSNGILTINRGTLPLALLGSRGYATLLGWLAVPVLLAQAIAPTVTAPVVGSLPALQVFLLAAALAALGAALLLPLRLPQREVAP
jgi:MFS family permease